MTTIEEPTVQTGRVRTFLLKVMAPFGGQMIPGGTPPVVVEKATGSRVKGSHAASTSLIGEMQADLHTMSAAEFRARYLDF
ncbi:MAG: hypothetical protein OEO77_02530 [Acidimicrobiia bacterium]|nr:hypothetical protein [Acidimicrobiia bacterium]